MLLHGDLMADLTRLEFTLPANLSAENPDLLPAFLALYVAHGWEEQSLPTGEVRCIVHSGHPGFCTELTRSVSAMLPDVRIVSSQVEEENWAEAWKEFFTPVTGGEHFLVLAPWMREERAKTQRIPVIIEPKTAFGTGHHATTSLCLDALSALFAEGRVTPQSRFLDLGTGSGILGIAAALLGLSGEGLDIDIAAVDNAAENRELNAVPEARFTVQLGGAEKANGPYDFIMANILAGPLREMAPQIVAALASHDSLDKGQGNKGILVLSGILDIQADAVEAAYTALGLPKPTRSFRGEWVCLTFA